MNLKNHARSSVLLLTVLVLLSFTLPAAPRVAAQTPPDSVGREFFFAYSHFGTVIQAGSGFLQQPTLFVASASSSTANGTLTIADGSFAPVNFSVAPGSLAIVEIPPTDRVVDVSPPNHPHAAPNGLSEKSFRVTTDQDVTIYFLNYVNAATDAALLMPSDAVGTLYVIPSYPGLNADGWHSFYLIVAQEDDTVVTISESDGTAPPNGTPDSLPQLYISNANTFDTSEQVTLQAGEVYLVHTSDDKDLSGTVIESSKPTVVFGGTDCALVPVPFDSCDQLLDAVPSVDTWGTEYISTAATGRFLGDTLRVFAWADGTKVRIDGELIATLDAGEYLEYRRASTDGMYIQSSLPVMAVRYFNSRSYDGDLLLGDPSMTVMQPLSQNSSRYVVGTAADVPAYFGGEEYSNSIGIVAPAGVDVNLNGNPVSGWVDVADSGYRSTVASVDPGIHTLTADEPFQVFVSGLRSFESYAYIGGSRYEPTWEPRWGGLYDGPVTEPIDDDVPTPVCDLLPDMAVSPQFINLAPGGTATVEVTLRNLCNDRFFQTADLLVSLSDGLTVIDGSAGMINLGQRAAWQQLALKPGETRTFTLLVQAPQQLVTAPLHVSELYYGARVINRIDGVFIMSEPADAPAETAPAEVPAASTAAPVPLPASLPNTAGAAGAALPLLPLALALFGAALLLRRR